MIILENRASVAQQVEHPAVNRTVGSSSLSRGATYLPLGINEGLVKTLWNIRNLSKNMQIIYSKNLRRLARESNLNEPKNIEELMHSFIQNMIYVHGGELFGNQEIYNTTLK